MLSGFVPSDQLTERLFDNETLERFRLVMPVIDAFNRKYDRDTVRWAKARLNGSWRAKAARCSPHYTLRPTDVPTLY
jgi:hypothetical protein